MGGKPLKWLPAIMIIANILVVVSFSGCSKLNSMMTPSAGNDMGDQGNTLRPSAVAEFVSSVRPYQESVESISRRARYFQETGKYRLAIQEFRVVVERDPTSVEAYNSMGVCYDLLGDYGRAVDCYKQALAINHDLAYVHNNLGYSYSLQGRLDSAVEAFKKAISLNALQARYHNNLGLAYARKGQVGLAFQELALGGGEVIAHNNLARILSAKGLDAEAKENLDRIQITTQPHLSTDLLAGNTAGSDELDLYKPKDITLEFAASSRNEKISAPDEVISRTHNPSPERSIHVLSSTGIEHRGLDVEVALTKLNANAEDLQQPIVGLSYRTVISEEAGMDKRYVGRKRPFNDLNQAESAARELALINGGHTVSVKETKELVLVTPHGGKKEEVRSSDSKDSDKSTNGDEPRIEVSNGNGISFMARDVSRYLGKKGSKVHKLSNSESFCHEKTIIYYCDGYLAHAHRIAEELPGWNELKKVQKLRNPDIKIRLVIGKDLAPFRETFDSV